MALIKDYQGTEFDWETIKKLANQIPNYWDTSNISGGVFSTSGEMVGFNYDELKKFLGREPTSKEQVAFDMARWAAKNGITDMSQLTPQNNPIQKPQSDYDLGIDPNTYRLGETYAGKGGTSYWVNFDQNGKPIISTSGYSTSDKGKIAKALAVAALLYGGYGLLGGAGGGTAAGAGAAGAGAGAAGAGAAGAGLTTAEIAALADVGMGLNTSALAGAAGAGAAGALGQGAWLGEGIASGIAPWDIAYGDALLAGGAGLSPPSLTGAEALTGTDAMIAAGEGMVPITAEQVATTGLTQAELGALGSGIGLGGPGTGLLSNIGNYLAKNPSMLNTIAKLLGAGAAGAAGSGGGGGAGGIPTQGIPTNTPEYYQALQNYYNAYLPGTNPNVGAALADWYGGKYTA